MQGDKSSKSLKVRILFLSSVIIMKFPATLHELRTVEPLLDLKLFDIAIAGVLFFSRTGLFFVSFMSSSCKCLLATVNDILINIQNTIFHVSLPSYHYSLLWHKHGKYVQIKVKDHFSFFFSIDEKLLGGLSSRVFLGYHYPWAFVFL